MSDKDDLKARINEFRRRVVAGENVPDEELKQAIHDLQRFRSNAAEKATAAPKTPKGKSTKAADKQKAIDLLGDLL